MYRAELVPTMVAALMLLYLHSGRCDRPPQICMDAGQHVCMNVWLRTGSWLAIDFDIRRYTQTMSTKRADNGCEACAGGR